MTKAKKLRDKVYGFLTIRNVGNSVFGMLGKQWKKDLNRKVGERM